jgi:hypothetical protein
MSFKKTLYKIQNNVVQFPCIRLDDVEFRPDAHLSKHHPSKWKELFVQMSLYVQKLQTVLGCIRSDVSATRPDAFQWSISKMISFQNTDKERQLKPSERCGYSVRTLSLIRQAMQKTFNRPDVRLHGPDVRLHGPDAQALYGNFVQQKCNRPNSWVTPSKRGPIQERISSEFGKPVAQLSIWTPSATIRMPPRKIVLDAI